MEGRKIVPGSSISIADRGAKYNGNGLKITVFALFPACPPACSNSSVLRKWLCDIGFGQNHLPA